MDDNHDDFWDNDYLDDDWKIHHIDESLDNINISGSGGKGSGGVLKVVVFVCIGICILALLLGVAIPGEVIALFVKIIFVVGFLTLLKKLLK